MSKYDDMIGLIHHVSRTHPRMPVSDRAAQFAPFAALTGYDDVIAETGRLTSAQTELDEARLTELDAVMQDISPDEEVTFVYFVRDGAKAGGRYESRTGRIRRILPVSRQIALEDGTMISASDVIEILR